MTKGLIEDIAAATSQDDPADIIQRYRELAHHLGARQHWVDETSSTPPDPVSIVQLFADYAQWNISILTRELAT